MSILADEAGLEFILPVAKWRGYQGKANVYGRSFETLTHGAALAALTKRIAIFSTVHVPLVTPAFAAKAIATIDHVSARPRRPEHRLRLEPERVRSARRRRSIRKPVTSTAWNGSRSGRGCCEADRSSTGTDGSST